MVNQPDGPRRVTDPANSDEMGGLEALFRAALYRTDCPTPDELLQYEANLLALGERRAVESHLAGCDLCREELSMLAGVPAAQTAGPGLREQLAQGTRSWLQGILQPLPAAAALRGSAESRLLYQAGDFQIVLATVAPSAGEPGWQVEGQLLQVGHPDREYADFQAELHAGRGTILTEPLDETGFFLLAGVPSGTHTLYLQSPEVEIALENLILTQGS